jgi:predicted secreted protein
VAALAGSGGTLLFLDQPRGDRGTAGARKEICMKTLLLAIVAAWTGVGIAADAPPPTTPVVTLSASATASVANDRMFAWLRIEADNPDPARAAAEVNGKMAKAIARAKAAPGIEVTTSGYSSYQFNERGQPSRWRVAQSLTLEGSDFATMAALVSRLQADDQMVLSGMNFAVSPDTRRKTEDALTQQAIKAWQARAQNAARGFGFDTWHAGKVSIQTGEPMRPMPMMRAQAAGGMPGGAPPVNVEGGSTDVTVTVSGEAVLEGPKR